MVFRAARAWNQPATMMEKAKLDQTPRPTGEFAVEEVVECAFRPALYQA